MTTTVDDGQYVVKYEVVNVALDAGGGATQVPLDGGGGGAAEAVVVGAQVVDDK